MNSEVAGSGLDSLVMEESVNDTFGRAQVFTGSGLNSQDGGFNDAGTVELPHSVCLMVAKRINKFEF